MKKYAVFLTLVCCHTYVFVSQDNQVPADLVAEERSGTLVRTSTNRGQGFFLVQKDSNSSDSPYPSRDTSSVTRTFSSKPSNGSTATGQTATARASSDSDSEDSVVIDDKSGIDDPFKFEFPTVSSDPVLPRSTALTSQDFVPSGPGLQARVNTPNN